MTRFQPASVADFHHHHRRFRTLFTPASPGERIWWILNTSEALNKMAVVTDCLDTAAVSGLAKELWPFIEPVLQDENEHRRIATAIGGIVRTVMVANGFETTGVKRAVPPVVVNGKRTRVFRSGEVYRRARFKNTPAD